MRQDAGSFEELRPAHEARDPVAAPARAAEGVLTIELVPRTSGRILDLALDIARERFGLYVAAASAIWFVARVLQPFVHRYTQLDPASPDVTPEAVVVSFGVTLVNLFVVVVVQSLATALIAILAWPVVLGTTVSLRTAAWHALRHLPGVLLIQLVTGMAVGVLGVCTCGIGWLWIQWKMSLGVIVYVLERGGLGAAFTRTFQLTSRDGWGWPSFAGFLRWLAVFATATTASFFFQGIATLDDAAPLVRAGILDQVAVPPWLVDAGLVLVTTLLNGAATAILSIALLAYYIDCRVRRDGWDLEQRLQALQLAAAGSNGARGAPERA